MNIFSCIKMYRWKCFALAAAIGITIAASGVLEQTVQEIPLVASAEEQSTETNEVLDPKLEDLVMYRWERVTWDNYEKLVMDGEGHLSLLIAENGCVLNGTLEKNAVRGADSAVLPGLQRTNVITKTHPLWTNNSELTNNVAIQHSHYIYCGIIAGYNDSQIDPNSTVFYTDDDRDGIYIKYAEKNPSITVDDVQVPRFHIGLRSTGEMYWLYGHDYSYSSRLELDKAKGDAKNQWTFEPTASRQWWKIRMYDGSDDDEWLMCRNGSPAFYWFTADGDRKSTDDCRWYIGEQLRFSKIQGSRTVGKGQVLPIGSGQFIQDDNSTADTNGVILTNGSTITINKGGILSISGAFLNNGTIINNGGTILVKAGGSISPFQQGINSLVNGCGKIICNDGDIIIQKGGAIYGGLRDEKFGSVDFRMNGHSTLINQGLLVYERLFVEQDARVELYENSCTYGGAINGGAKEVNMLFLYNQDLMKGDAKGFGTYTIYTQYGVLNSTGLCRTSSDAKYPVTILAAKSAKINDVYISRNGFTVGDLTL